MKVQQLVNNYSGVAMKHYSETCHGKFSFHGAGKREKMQGVYCKICKKFITPIRVVTK